MKEYFNLFSSLVENLRAITNQSSCYNSKIEAILDEMEKLTSTLTVLESEHSNVIFYRNTIKSLFQKNLADSYKYSFYTDLKREYEVLSAFAKANKLM